MPTPQEVIERTKAMLAQTAAEGSKPFAGSSYDTGGKTLPSIDEVQDDALSLPNAAEGGLLGFKDTLSAVVDLAKRQRNQQALGLMMPFQGTVAASDFNSILGNLNKASETFTQDVLSRAIPKPEDLSKNFKEVQGGLYDVSTGKFVVEPQKDYQALTLKDADGQEYVTVFDKKSGKIVGSPSGGGGAASGANSKKVSAALEGLDLVNGIQSFGAQGLQYSFGIGRFNPGANIPGSQKHIVDAKIDQLVGFLSLENRQKLKGSGAISDFEFRVLAQASSVLNNRMISPEQAEAALKKISGVFRTAAGLTTTVKIIDKSGKSAFVTANKEQIEAALADGLTIEYQ